MHCRISGKLLWSGLVDTTGNLCLLASHQWLLSNCLNKCKYGEEDFITSRKHLSYNVSEIFTHDLLTTVSDGRTSSRMVWQKSIIISSWRNDNRKFQLPLSSSQNLGDSFKCYAENLLPIAVSITTKKQTQIRMKKIRRHPKSNYHSKPHCDFLSASATTHSLSSLEIMVENAFRES